MSSPTTLVAKSHAYFYHHPEVHYPIDLGLGVSLWELEINKSGQNPQSPLSDSDTANPYPYSTPSPTQHQEAVLAFRAQDNISSAILTPEELSPSTLAPGSSESPSEVPQPSSTTTTPANTQSYTQISSSEQLEEERALSVLIREAQNSPTPIIHIPISSPSSSHTVPAKSQYKCSICSKAFDRRYKLK